MAKEAKRQSGKVSGKGLAKEPFEAMQRYIDRHERSAPVVFVGRDGILSDLMSAVKATAMDDAKGMTRVVQGVPGAGKTAICEEFTRKHQSECLVWTDEDGKEEKAILFCVQLDPSALDAPPLSFVQGIHEKWRRHCLDLKAGKGRAALGHLDRGSDILRLWLNRNTEHESAKRIGALNEHSSLDVCLSTYARDYWGDDMAIALCVDEVQNCPATKQSRSILGSLHNRTHPARIVPLLFGLPNALDYVSDRENGLGLSRLNARACHEICLLELGQAREIATGTFDKLGLEWSNPNWGGCLAKRGFSPRQWHDWRDRIADAVADGSSNFPQHVTLGLSIVCEVLIDRRKTLAPNNLAEVLQDIQTKHHQIKITYYEQRMNAIIQHGAAFGSICRAASRSANGGITRAEAKRAIAVGSDEDDKDLTSEQAGKILEKAMEKGVLRRLKNGRIAPPDIPSMATYLDGLFQDALDAEEAPAVCALRALRLTASAADTPANR